MIVLLEAETDPCNLDTSCELVGPCFEASAQCMVVSESIVRLELHFDCQVSGPLVQECLPSKSVVETTTSYDLVFSSDTSTYRLQANLQAKQQACTS